jgi:myo-inositol-1-phosphate synthase
MPTAVKEALVRETARRGASLNDVAVGMLADAFGLEYAPTNRRSALPGSSPVVLLRMPEVLKDRIQAESRRSGANTNDVILGALADELGIPFRSNRTSSHRSTPRRSVPFRGGRGKDVSMAASNGSTNGNARQKDKVRVAIIGVGNCANSLLQGVEYYKDAASDGFVPGLMHVDLGGYHISDIEFTAAFDVVKGKVGVDLADAIWAHPNDTIKFADVPKTGITVSRGMTHDGIGKYLSQVVEKAPGETADIVGILRETGTDVVVNYLPVGSESATKWYTEKILEAGCAMVNCMPVFIAREHYWQKRFEDAGVPIIGDDIKSQVGATISHRVLTSLFRERGVHLDRTMQLNVGGNSDFRNMLERERLESKKISKTNAVTSMLDYDLGEGNVHVGPSDYVPWLTDRKWAYIRMEGTSFGDVPLNLELKLEVWDSPNSAGIVIDAVRLAKLALNNGVSGALEAPSSYLMKSPPVQIVDDEAHAATERFIKQYALKAAKAAKTQPAKAETSA